MERNEIKSNLIKWIQTTKNTHALMHKSYQSKNNYENLEILGDAYLNFYTVDVLFNKFDTPSEITKHKKVIVSNENLSRVFKEFEIIKYIKLGDSLKPNEISDKIEGDFIESIIGGIYLDSKQDESYKELLNSFIEKCIILDYYQHKIHDYKSYVYEKAQKYNIKINTEYNTEGPDHAVKHICELTVIFQDGKIFKVVQDSNTKKQATQECCKKITEMGILPK